MSVLVVKICAFLFSLWHSSRVCSWTRSLCKTCVTSIILFWWQLWSQVKQKQESTSKGHGEVPGINHKITKEVQAQNIWSKKRFVHILHAPNNPIVLSLGDIAIISKNEISVLTVVFGLKLQWSNLVSTAIKKAISIKLISKYFTSKELLLLLASNYYSVLYYNTEAWHLGSLKRYIKNQLMSTFTNVICVALHYPDPLISFQ
jgi:hypothetical protein